MSQGDFPSVLQKSSPFSEAHWKPLSRWGLFPVPSIAWPFLHIPLHPCRAQAGQKPTELLWIRIWPLAVALAPQGDWAGQGTGKTDEGLMVLFHELRGTEAGRERQRLAQGQGDLASFITSVVGNSDPLKWPRRYSPESFRKLSLLLLHREKQPVPMSPLTCWGSYSGAGHPQSHGVLPQRAIQDLTQVHCPAQICL